MRSYRLTRAEEKFSDKRNPICITRINYLGSKNKYIAHRLLIFFIIQKARLKQSWNNVAFLDISRGFRDLLEEAILTSIEVQLASCCGVRVGFRCLSFLFNTSTRRMERRAWTPQEDQVLKNLYEKVKVNKWSLIAKTMQEEYSLPPRTGKQCRERYNNHLNPFFAKVEWTREEEDRLFTLHNELGNKWAIIATKLGGRTDNGVKNHFFAKLRKSMRKINRIIQKHFKQKLKELKISVLYKIVEASEERFKKKPMCDAQKSQFSCYLKNEILKYVYDRSEEQELLNFKTLIEQIHHFAKSYRRRPKQLRRISDKQSSFSEPGEPISGHSQPESDHQDSQDQIIRFSGEFQVFKYPCKQDSREIKRQLRSKASKFVPSQIDQVPNHQPQPVLKGLLVDEEEYPLLLPPPPNLMKRHSNSELMGDSIKNQQFFEESGIHCSIPPLMFSSELKKSNEDEFFKH